MITLLVHGGAGSAHLVRQDPQRRNEERRALAQACAAGQAILVAGGPAVDAVVAAVEVLEDCPLFNAGRGAALTRDGTAELDAALMDGNSGRCGGVMGLTAVRHPIHAARLVMERSGHVLMHGVGAQHFALENGAESADPAWFITAQAQRNLADWRNDPQYAMRGTVGAVALDASGHLAAATSSGGLTGKRSGRVGDAPIPGAGTWADARVAVSATGDGEAFVRAHFAGRIAVQCEHGVNVNRAAEEALKRVAQQSGFGGGTGGCIVLCADGTWSMPFTTADMRRGCAIGHATPRVAIFGDEDPT
ncbi:MAG: isoaspartyl peptidase/L-asparaginase [Planctomycetota bacterium]